MITSRPIDHTLCLIGAIMLHLMVFNLMPSNKPLHISVQDNDTEISFLKNEPDILLPANHLIAKTTVIKQQKSIPQNKHNGINPLPSKGKQTDTSLLKYQDAIKQKIQQNKKYPRWALRTKHQGTVQLSFKVQRDGGVKDLTILQKSPFSELNQEAINAVIRAQPFASFPHYFKMNYIIVKIDIIFQIKKGS